MYIKFQFFCSGALYLRFETCLECICVACLFLFKTFTILLILSSLSDFITCIASFNIKSEGFISQLGNTVGR